MNITDMDDKTIEGSEKAGKDLLTFTQEHIATIKSDLELLGIAKASKYPLASDHVEDMVRLTEKLVRKGAAYEKLRSLYFDISRFSEYGKLSGIDLEKIRLGATVDLDDYEKDNPRDFTLLKRSKLSELKRGIFTGTPWGNVRPSWHVQCAAMSLKHLGEQYDIQASGRELIFPHHENRIAIAGALTGKLPARYWVHCERVLVDGKKIDAQNGRLTLGDFIEMGYTGQEVRYWLLAGHYRKPITFSTHRLDDARQSLKRLSTCVHFLKDVKSETGSYPELNQLVYDIKNGFIAAMDDDLNTSAALASVFKNVRKINILCQEKKLDREGAAAVLGALEKIDSVMGIFNFSREAHDAEVNDLMALRDKARQEGNWKEADGIRERLAALGMIVRDSKVGGR
jgi:cysteinyl-tRNA synthetase